MRFIEYKKHLIGGELRDPEFVVNGGHWYDSINSTYVAVVPDIVEYYLPDTLVFLTREQIDARALSIHARNPLIKYDGTAGSGGTPVGNMTDEQVIDYVSTWISQLG